MGTLGSRSTFHMGNAVRLAAEDAKRKIAALAASWAFRPAPTLPHPNVPAQIRDAGRQHHRHRQLHSPYEKPDRRPGIAASTPFWGVGASGAEVEVDIETGHFRITKLVNVADVGIAINPQLVKVQLSGAAIMQLGFTMTEEMVFRDGQLTNGSLADYKIPTMLDLPLDFVNEMSTRARTMGPSAPKAREKARRSLVAGDRKRARRRYRRAH